MNKEPKNNICLTMNSETAAIVSRACEFYARIRLGQFQEILFELRQIPYDCSSQESAETLLFEARKYIFPELIGRGHSYGVGHDKKADQAYDVHQVIRYELGDSRKPWFCSDACPECKGVR